MGFVSCPNCFKCVSELAEISACPECFHPMNPQKLRLELGKKEQQRHKEEIQRTEEEQLKTVEELQRAGERLKELEKKLIKAVGNFEKSAEELYTQIMEKK